MNVTTTKGEMDEALLEKRTGFQEDENERSEWVEYWFNGELVHRSALVEVKRFPATTIEVGGFGG